MALSMQSGVKRFFRTKAKTDQNGQNTHMQTLPLALLQEGILQYLRPSLSNHLSKTIVVVVVF